MITTTVTINHSDVFNLSKEEVLILVVSGTGVIFQSTFYTANNMQYSYQHSAGAGLGGILSDQEC